MNRKLKVLIIGGTGYLGRKVLKELCKDGYEVSCTYLLGEDYESIIHDKVEFIKCDIARIKEKLEWNHYDWIINLAARYEKKNTRVLDVIDVNSVLGLQLLALACDYHIGNFLTIDTSLPENVNLYSYAKKKVADFGKYAADKYDINVMNLQPEMFYGDDEPEERFIPSCIKKMKAGEPLELTEGTQIRDIIHVRDVVEIIMKIIDREPRGYNDIPIGTGEGVSIRKIVEYIHECTASRSELRFGAVQSRNNEPNCIADTDKLFSIIGRYDFKYNWKSGILDSIHKSENSGG